MTTLLQDILRFAYFATLKFRDFAKKLFFESCLLRGFGNTIYRLQNSGFSRPIRKARSAESVIPS